MIETDRAYYAGFFDGEGSVGLFKSSAKDRIYINVRVRLVNTQFEVLEEIHRAYGGSLSKEPLWLHTRQKPIKQWQANGSAAVSFLTDIRPYIRLKGPQIDLALEFWKRRAEAKARSEKWRVLANGQWLTVMRMRDSDREIDLDYCMRMQALNRRGFLPPKVSVGL